MSATERPTARITDEPTFYHWRQYAAEMHLRHFGICRGGYQPVHTDAISVRQLVDVECSRKQFSLC